MNCPKCGGVHQGGCKRYVESLLARIKELRADLVKQIIGNEIDQDGVTTYLYRHFDKDGVLLYVGISINALVRTAQHAKRHWYKDIKHIEIEEFPNRLIAKAEERAAIRIEKPIHNILHKTVTLPATENKVMVVDAPVYEQSNVTCLECIKRKEQTKARVSKHRAKIEKAENYVES